MKLTDKIFKCLVQMALIDASLQPAEREYLLNFRSQGLSLDRAKELMAEARQSKTATIPKPESAEDRQQIFELLFAMGAVDVQLSSREQDFLKRIGRALEIPEAGIKLKIDNFLCDPGLVVKEGSAVVDKEAAGHVVSEAQQKRVAPGFKPNDAPRRLEYFLYYNYALYAQPQFRCGTLLNVLLFMIGCVVLFPLILLALPELFAAKNFALIWLLIGFLFFVPSLIERYLLRRHLRWGEAVAAVVEDVQLFKLKQGRHSSRQREQISYSYEYNKQKFSGGFCRGRQGFDEASCQAGDAMWVIVDTRRPHVSLPDSSYWSL
jgi:hypothetical protein